MLWFQELFVGYRIFCDDEKINVRDDDHELIILSGADVSPDQGDFQLFYVR